MTTDPLSNDKPQIVPEAISARDWDWRSLPIAPYILQRNKVRRALQAEVSRICGDVDVSWNDEVWSPDEIVRRLMKAIEPHL